MTEAWRAVAGVLVIAGLALLAAWAARRRGRSDDELVTVGRFVSPDQAQLARLELERYDIEAFVLDELGGLAFPSPSGAKLQVRARDEEAARRILEAEDGDEA